MPTLCLTRRKTQLELLAQLCDDRRQVRVRPQAAAPTASEINTRFLALESDGVLFEWPLRGIDNVAVVGATVTVAFEHAGQEYAFRSETYGRVWWTCPRRGPVAAWKLRLPLRIDEWRQRRHARLELDESGPIAARFTSVVDPGRAFAARLHNVSAGGLQAVTRGPTGAAVRPGELYWAEFDLPGEDERLEFVVRVAHTRVSPRDQGLVIGCTFCPADDSTRRHGQLERVERFVARRVAAVGTLGFTPPGGE